MSAVFRSIVTLLQSAALQNRTYSTRRKHHSHQYCHSRSSRHKTPDDTDSRWVHWDLQACPTHQMGAHFQSWKKGCWTPLWKRNRGLVRIKSSTREELLYIKEKTYGWSSFTFFCALFGLLSSSELFTLDLVLAVFFSFCLESPTIRLFSAFHTVDYG